MTTAVLETPGAASASPSLVGIPHNSSNPADSLATRSTFCPDARYMKAYCREHDTTRYVPVPCKRRDCPDCGPKGRYLIAEHIALGVRELWPCAWIVLTFPEDVTRSKAARRLSNFVKQLRKKSPGMQYAATYELTKAGRIHINLIAGPWDFIPQRTLEAMWGARLWVERVKHDAAAGREAAKSYSPEALGGYLAKLEQAVPYGRRCSFSKGWPKLPKPVSKSPDYIDWRPLTDDETLWLFMDIRSHRVQVLPCGDYVPARFPEECTTWCDCMPTGIPPPDYPEPPG